MRRQHWGFAVVAATIMGWLGLAVATTYAQEPGSTNRPIIACSTTQVADFARQVAGDLWEVKCVLAPGQDPHMYQLDPNAIKLVQSATLCFDNGMHLEGDDWMRTVADKENKPIFSCTDGIKPLVLEEKGESVNDPHAWFSPSNAARYVGNIQKALIAADPKNKVAYEARGRFYLGQLKSLDAWAKREINRIPPSKRVLVTSHDAFNYFCQAYKLKPAAPVGWSTGEVGGNATMASSKEVVDSIREAGVPAIFVETSVNRKAIDAIAKQAGVVIGGKLYSDSMGGPGTAGETYLGMMRENVITIVGALTSDSP